MRYRLFFPGLFIVLSSFIFIFFSGCSNKIQTTPAHMPDNRASDQFAVSAEKMSDEGQFKTSNFFYQRAIEGYEKTDSWEKAIRCYIKLGENAQKMDDVASAMGNLNKALDLTKKQFGTQNLELAKSYGRLAFKCLKDKDFTKAEELYRKALAIQLEILGKDSPEVAKTYNNIALIQLNEAKINEANTNILKAYMIKVKNRKDVPKEIDKKFRSIDLDIRNFKKGEFDQARNQFNKSLEEYNKQYGQNKPLFISIYEQIGILYALEGNYDKAFDYIRKAFDTRIEIYGDGSVESGTGYLNIGICLRLKGEFEAASKYLDNALKIKIEHRGEFHPDIADIYCQIGKLLFQQDMWDQALENFQKALICCAPPFKSMDTALNPELRDEYPHEKLLEILSAKADTLRMYYFFKPENERFLKNAFATYRVASYLIENMRKSYKADYFKLYFGEKNHSIYQYAIQTALMLYDLTEIPSYKEDAFYLSEKSKAGVLAEALYEAHARKFAGITKDLLEDERKIREDLTFFDTCLEIEKEVEKPDPTKIKTLESSYYSSILKYRELIKRIETEYPQYYNLKYHTPDLLISDIQKNINSDTALLEYFIGDHILHIFVITNEGFNVFSVTVEDDFDELISNFNQSIKKIEETPFINLSSQLYQLLIKPVYSSIKDKSRLIIIPDGLLYTIPFEALSDVQTSQPTLSTMEYIVRQFAINYHYSVNLWMYGSGESQLSSKMSFIGFAPIFGNEDKPGYILSTPEDKPGVTQRSMPVSLIRDEPGFSLSELPASEEELRSIIELFKLQGKPATGFFYRMATKENFKIIEKENYNFIHIATHSIKKEEYPPLSGLLFSSGEQKHGQDGSDILFAGEIYNMNLNSDLVVLSSCESGIGKLIKGEGMMALNRGFFYAGIRNIVFSLWKVEDRSTSRLMIAFYKNILSGFTFPKALRNAKLELLRDPFTAFPKYWSGFILVGR